MRLLQTSLIVLVVAFVVILVTQIWFDLFPEEIFFKINLTFFIIFTTVVAIIFIKKCSAEESQLKKDKFID